MINDDLTVHLMTLCQGTGKTLVARALANECSSSDTKVAFFMRKGADCLSKWVGESERQLRLLFDQVSFSCLFDAEFFLSSAPAVYLHMESLHFSKMIILL